MIDLVYSLITIDPPVDLSIYSTTVGKENAPVVVNQSTVQGLNTDEVNALQFGGNINSDENLPLELGFIVDQNYNDHSMLTRAKNGVVKPKTFEGFYCYSDIAQQKLYDEYPCNHQRLKIIYDKSRSFTPGKRRFLVFD